MKKILKTAVLLACCGILAGCGAQTEQEEKTTVRTEKGDTEVKTVNAVQAEYPEMPPYPNEQEYIDKKTGEFDDEGFSKVYDAWWEAKRERRDLPKEVRDSLRPFFTASIRRFLTEEEESGNIICSPVNIYMALSMLAETAGGDSRQQILDLAGADSLEGLRSQAGQVWNASYSSDGAVTSLLANSLWLDEDISFKKETLESLAEHCYASSFWGQMGSPEMDERLKGWLNEQTKDLLKEQASGIHLTDDTLLALASTIYFRAKWSREFFQGNTVSETFHGISGDTACDFMHQGGTDTYYWGDTFGAVGKGLQESGRMWLILPDEGVTPQEVLMEDQVMELLLSGEEWKDQKTLTVNLAIPKFDAVSDISLREGLQSLGVTDVFDEDKSDFTPLTDAQGLFVSRASHAARVMVDEEGCLAAAYTVMAVAGAGMPHAEEMDFVLDRPFIFVITSDSGLPLFAGIVNEP